MSILLALHFESNLEYKDYEDLKNISHDEIEKDPNNPQIHDSFLKRGEAKRNLGDLSGAESDLSVCIDIYWEQMEYDKAFYVLLMRGLARFDSGNIHGAKEDIKKAWELDFLFPDFFLKDFYEPDDRNIKEIDKLISICPEWPLAYLVRASVRYDFEGCVHVDILFSDIKQIMSLPREIYFEALNYSKDFIDTICLCCDGIIECLIDDDKHSFVFTICQGLSELILIQPSWSNLFWYRGFYRIEIGDYQGAIDDYDIVIKANSKDGIAFYNRGEAKFKLGRYEEAEKDYQHAVTLRPDEKFSPYQN